jgi:hypothetical protein
VSVEDLKGVFLATSTSLADGSRVEPVLENSALQTYYRSLLFTGKGAMPKAFASDADVVAYVAKTKRAAGYVDAAAAKTLQVR